MNYREIGNSIAVPGGIRVVDAKGKLVMPGPIDIETNFQFKFNDIQVSDDVYYGTKYALSGGSTTIVDYIIPHKNESLTAAFTRTIELFSQKSNSDYCLVCQIREFSGDKTLDEVDKLISNGIRVFHLPSENSLNSENINTLMSHLAKRSCLFSVSSFDHNAFIKSVDDATTIDNFYEKYDSSKDKAFVLNIMEIAKRNSVRVIFNDVVSEEIFNIITEEHFVVIPVSHLAITKPSGGDLVSKCAKFVLPPLLQEDRKKNLVQVLSKSRNNLTVSSSHKGFSQKLKDDSNGILNKLPPGCGGCVERLSILWENTQTKKLCEVNQFVNYASTNPAKMLNIYPKKGTLQVGSDADILIWEADVRRNLGREQVQFSNIAFNGIIATGSPYLVIANGKVVSDEDKRLRVTQGGGRFIPCSSQVSDKLMVGDNNNKAAPEEIKPAPEVQSLVQEVKNVKVQENNQPPKNPNGYHSSIKIHNPPGGKSSGLW